MTARDASGALSFLEADTVVVVAGFRPLSEEADAFLDATFDVCAVGDCRHVGDINTATRSGYDAALSL